MVLTYLVILVVLLPLAFLPTIIAIKKKHPHKLPIILVNIFGGLLWGIGWIVALVWCFVDPTRGAQPPRSAASEIEKLHALKEKGAITQDEFDAKKRELLNVGA